MDALLSFIQKPKTRDRRSHPKLARARPVSIPEVVPTASTMGMPQWKAVVPTIRMTPKASRIKVCRVAFRERFDQDSTNCRRDLRYQEPHCEPERAKRFLQSSKFNGLSVKHIVGQTLTAISSEQSTDHSGSVDLEMKCPLPSTVPAANPFSRTPPSSLKPFTERLDFETHRPVQTSPNCPCFSPQREAMSDPGHP